MLWIHLIFPLPALLGAQTSAGTAEQGNAFYFQGDHQRALDAYQSAIKRSSSPAACLDAAVVLQDLNRNKDAIGMLEGCIRTSPSDPRLRSALAWACHNEGDVAKAKAGFAEARKRDPARSLDLLGMAQAALEEKEYGRALEILDELAKKRPRLALAYFYRGKVHEARREWEEAIRSYQQGLREDSHFVEIRPLLAALFERQKQGDEAWRQYAKIVQVHPKNRAAREGKERLAPLLTRKPEEIIPPKRIARHSLVSPSPGWETNPTLRIGIGSSIGGGVPARKAVTFRTAAPFALLDADTGKELARGGADEIWTATVDSSSRYEARLVDPQGKVAATFKGSIRVRMEGRERRTTIVDGLSYAPGYAWGGTADKELRGEIEISLSPADKSLVIVNIVNSEEYLYGVLNSEMPTHWPMEALKAQAVLARTQALYRQGTSRPHKSRGYDLCDEQHCQVYGGVAAETIRARAAVDSTRGRILAYHGKPAHTIFFSNCGGHTQSGKEAGWGDVPYWQAVSDIKSPSRPPRSPWELKEWLQNEPAVYCNIPKYMWSPELRWTRVVSAEDLESRMPAAKGVGRIKGITPLRRSRSGHINALKIRGVSGELVLEKEHEIRRLLGLGPLRSTLFVVETVSRKGRGPVFTFYGGGWGHGVGMCQAGAGGRAEGGASYEEILRHYYPGTVLGPWTNAVR